MTKEKRKVMATLSFECRGGKEPGRERSTESDQTGHRFRVLLMKESHRYETLSHKGAVY